VPGNLLLIHLPAYPPELNSMEHVWEYLRAYRLSFQGVGGLRRHRRGMRQRLELVYGGARAYSVDRGQGMGNGRWLGRLVLVPTHTTL
jgi:hypothetical protein